jgi:hypothetical protein
MAFKLGKSKGPTARGGKIISKMKFGKRDEVVPGVPVFKKQLGPDIIAEANMDGSIFVSKDVDENSPEYQQAMVHEVQHITAMRIGSETYDDDNVYFQGEVWPRKNGYITDPSTGKKYEEGSKDLPWENNKI